MKKYKKQESEEGPEGRRSSRRALLAGAAGGLAALGAQVLTRSAPASAADGDPLIAGSLNNSATVVTTLRNSDLVTECHLAGVGGLAGDGRDSGSGVRGQSNVSHGVSGLSSGAGSAGVRGENTDGILGGYGVRGEAGGSTLGVGVHGENTTGGGTGVRGVAHGNGIGVHALADDPEGTGLQCEGFAARGVALSVTGRAWFNRSGRTTIFAGQASRVIRGHSIVRASLVLATIQGNVPGVYVRGVQVNAARDTFTIL